MDQSIFESRRLSLDVARITNRPGPRMESGSDTLGGDAPLTEDPVFAAILRELADLRVKPSAFEVPVGAAFGPYVVKGELGRGAMGVVMRAFDRRLGREVALKITGLGVGRALAEARAAAALTHPHVAAIYDFGATATQAWIAMELVDGQTLRQRLSEVALSEREVLDIAIAIAKGLAAAHVRGIVHRDLKPENIARSRDGQWKILDFGIASLPSGFEARLEEQSIAASVRAATPAYASLRQMTGESPVPADDVYALGIVLREMLCGQQGPNLRRPRRDWEKVIATATGIEGRTPYSDGAAILQALLNLQKKLSWRRSVALIGTLLALGALLAWVTGYWFSPGQRQALTKGQVRVFAEHALADMHPKIGYSLVALLPGGEAYLYLDRGRLWRQLTTKGARPQLVWGDAAQVVALAAHSDGRHAVIRLRDKQTLHQIDLENPQAPLHDLAVPCLGSPTVARKAPILATECRGHWHVYRLGDPVVELHAIAHSHTGGIAAHALTDDGSALVFIGAGGKPARLEKIDFQSKTTQVLYEDPRLISSGSNAVTWDGRHEILFGLAAGNGQLAGIYQLSLTQEPVLWHQLAGQLNSIHRLDGDRLLIDVADPRLDLRFLALKPDVDLSPVTPTGQLFPSAWSIDRTLYATEKLPTSHAAVAFRPGEQSPRPVPGTLGRWTTLPTPSRHAGIFYFDLVADEPAGARARLVSTRAPDHAIFSLNAVTVLTRETPPPSAMTLRCATTADRCVVVEERADELRWHAIDDTLPLKSWSRVAIEAQDGRELALAADGETLAIVRNRARVIETLDLRGQSLRRLPFTSTCDLEKIQFDSASPGFVAVRQACNGQAHQIVRVHLDGTLETLLADDENVLTQPLPAPDGSILAYARISASYRVYLLEPRDVVF